MLSRVWRITVFGLALALGLAGCGGGSGRSGTDVVVTGEGSTGTLYAGDEVAFVMSVANRGDFAANVLTIRYAAIQISQSGLSITCSAAGGARCPEVLGPSMTLDTLPPGGSLRFDIASTLIAGASGAYSSTMSVSSESTDANPSNNTVSVGGQALSNDIVVSVTAPTGPVLVGETVFTADISNLGPSDAENVVLTPAASANVTFVAADIFCTTRGGAAAPVLEVDGTLRVPAIPVDGGLNCSVPLTVLPGTNGVVFVSMEAVSRGDARTGNNFQIGSVSATLRNDLRVSGSAAAPGVVGGASTFFTAVVSNSGPATASDVSLTYTLGPDLTLSGAFSCVPAGGAVAPVLNNEGVLVSPALPVGGTLTCTLALTVDAGANGIVFANVLASAAGNVRGAASNATITTIAASATLGVSQSAAVEAAAGTSTTFTARVNNPGPGTASNVRIDWTPASGAGLSFATPTCQGLGGAVCPEVLGPSMTVPSLPAGRTLIFGFTVTSADTFRGDVVNSVSVSAAEDLDPSNNTSIARTRIVDPRNGAYRLFAANGLAYDMVIDFDRGSYTLGGQGAGEVVAFTADAGGGGFTVSGTSRFRAATDVIVGGHDFGAGTLPYIAARRFTTTLGALAGSYNLATLTVPASGAVSTMPGTAFITGNTLSTCEREAAQVATVRNCDAASTTDYVGLQVVGQSIVGRTAAGEPYTFSIANSGALKILLSAGPGTDGVPRLRVGLLDSVAGMTFGGPQQGASLDGDWLTVSLVDGFPVLYTAEGTFTSDSAALVNITNSGAGPFSMMTGTSQALNGSIYVMQAFPLVVVVGGAPGFGGASDVFSITLP